MMFMHSQENLYLIRDPSVVRELQEQAALLGRASQERGWQQGELGQCPDQQGFCPTAHEQEFKTESGSAKGLVTSKHIYGNKAAPRPSQWVGSGSAWYVARQGRPTAELRQGPRARDWASLHLPSKEMLLPWRHLTLFLTAVWTKDTELCVSELA